MEPTFVHDVAPTMVLVPSIAVLIFVFLGYAFRQRGLDHIPTVGFSDPFLSWIPAVHYFFDARSILAQGYASYPQGTFKLATFYGWTVVLNGKQYVNDLARSNPNTLSSIKALVNLFQLEATFGMDFIEKHHHVASVIRTDVTRNLENRFNDSYQEVVHSFDECIPSSGTGWAPITAYSLAVDTISRVTSEYFFGKPLSNDPNFRDICEQATMEIFKASFVRPFPEFLKPVLVRYISRVPTLRHQMMQYLGPIIEQRTKDDLVYESGVKENSNDLITWLIEGGIANQKSITVDDITTRVLIISFTAIHTTSAVLTAALYQLCVNHQDVDILREEIEAVIEEEGWSRHAITQMRKLDSYLRELQRLHTISDLAISKVVMEDYAFSDGLRVPKGVNISINVFARHHATDNYPNPEVFDGFRHVRDQWSSQFPATGPTLDYHAFGHGRSACPGRFLAIMEIKMMLAHLILHYDFRLEKDEYPKKFLLDANALPSHEAKIFFRKRKQLQFAIS